MSTSVQEIELLAPAGRWEALEKVVAAGADAVYLGGKDYNMRQLRSDFNFSREELQSAVAYLHQRGKKIYITVNNLYEPDEITAISDYLGFLADLNVDALIVQDLGLVSLVKALNLSIPLHASVQMGIANFYTVKMLEQAGFDRVILSKNLSIEEIRSIHRQTKLGIEFFAHGDLCIAHTGQCYMSSFIAGRSSNKGLCTKPCRWCYILKNSMSQESPPGYFLASKDLCLIDHLKNLVEAGVTSFKIEGRMRDGEYLAHLVSHYRQSLQEIMLGPLPAVDYSARNQEISKKRVRNFTTANLFGNPGYTLVDTSGVREPIKFDSVLPSWNLKDFKTSDETYHHHSQEVALSVKISNLAQLQCVNAMQVADIIIAPERFRGLENFTEKEIMDFLQTGKNKNSKYLWESPRIVSQQDLASLQKQLERLAAVIDGVVANDLGVMYMAKHLGLPVRGGLGLNIINHQAAGFLQSQGVDQILASLELQFEQLVALINRVEGLEVLVQGPLCGMITDSCIICLPNQERRCDEGCLEYCNRGENYLKDRNGYKYLLRGDARCRNYIYYPYEMCLLTVLPELLAAGLKYLRIDAQFYDLDVTSKVIKIYQDYLESWPHDHKAGQEAGRQLMTMFPAGFTGCHRQVPSV